MKILWHEVTAKNIVFLTSDIFEGQKLYNISFSKNPYFCPSNHTQYMHLNDTLRTANMIFIFKYCKFKNVSDTPPSPKKRKKEGSWVKKGFPAVWYMRNPATDFSLDCISRGKNPNQQIYSDRSGWLYFSHYPQNLPLFLSFLQHGYCERPWVKLTAKIPLTS